jgi:glycosyltransferase involved in cell wall biosynthesis
LRIAVLAPIAWRVPPVHYGPWEQFASLLTEGLVARGHHVTLFASADSLTTATLSSVTPGGWSDDPSIEPKVAECLHIAAVFERAGEFDIIHNGFDFLPLTYSALVDTPVVTTIHGFSSSDIVAVYERYDATTTYVATIHGFSSEAIVPVYARYDATTAYVAISDADRHPQLSYAATILHGIDTDAFALHPSPGSDLLFFGRIHPDKGTADAIAVAQKTERRLVIAGIIQDHAYFEAEIAPHIDGTQIDFVGPVTAEQRAELLGRAGALLHLIHFDEPFGFSVAEALACGTPVIAHRRGSMPELIDHDRTGFIVDDLAGAIDAVHRVADLDRRAIRADAVARFGRGRMIDEYIDVYRRVLAKASP